MGRNISSKMRRQIQAEIDPIVKVFLITIHHSDLSEPIRVSSDPTERLFEDQYHVYYGTKSNGQDYLYAGFDACLTNDEDGAAPSVQITLPNADRKIIEAIETMGAGPIQVDLQLVCADTPNTVEIAIMGMEMSDITYDESSVSGIISRDLLFSEPYPFRSFTPQEWPFLFLSRVRE